VRRTLKGVLAEYGPVALVVYLAIFAATLAGFAIAIGMGFQPRGVAGGLGTLTAAYIATKVTQPLRIGATLVLTPFVARAIARVRRGTAPRTDA
jgi:hypothetical protein